MTTIVSLIKKDFQEVFPSIIGDEEHKLSIDEILGSSPDFIIKKIQNLKEAVNTERTELISFLNLLKIADEGLEYKSKIHYNLKRFSERYPNHKSFKFFVYRYVLSTSYDSDDYSLENFTYLIKRIIEDNSLMMLTDFISSGIGDTIIMLNEVSDELVSILKNAVLRYPNKIILLWITAHLYRVQKNYEEAIRYNKLFLEKLEPFQNPDSEENFDFDFVDVDAEQMVCFQLADLNFDVGDYTNALNYCNRVLVNDQDKEYSSFYYFDTLIIRIRIHMVSNNTEAFQKDYDELLKVFKEEELKENYADILSYAK